METGDYADFEHALDAAQALSDASEAHGTLAGALCAAHGYRLEDWLGEILPEGRAGDHVTATLRTVFEETRRELVGDEMTFRPVLPPDDRPLTERAQALGEWCQGFLYGLGTSPIPDPAGLPGEVGEVVRDLTQITQVAVDARETEESNESAYADLVEFVRVGVQLVFEELATLRAPPPKAAGSLH
jgi:hypothetical protein